MVKVVEQRSIVKVKQFFCPLRARSGQPTPRALLQKAPPSARHLSVDGGLRFLRRKVASPKAAQAELDAFEQGPWGQKFPTVVASWRRAWSNVIPFFAFPPAVRKVIYTTNAIESINARLRKIIKTRGHFPSDDAATKLIWLALRNITADWGRAAHDWKSAMNQFAILYEERFTRSTA